MDGLLYGYCRYPFAVLLPHDMQSKFGTSLNLRYKKDSDIFYGISGAARMETNEFTVIGELNDSGLWINGRLEIDRDTKGIFYRKYDREGNKIKNSTQEFVNFKWVKSTKGRVSVNNKDEEEEGDEEDEVDKEDEVDGCWDTSEPKMDKSKRKRTTWYI